MNPIFDITSAASAIREGELVAFPTETVYGLGADATNADAVLKIYERKQRPRFNPLIVHLADAWSIERYTHSVPEVARKLADRFWPGPLTLVLPKRLEISDVVTAGLPTVGVRIPNHPMALELIRQSGRPIAAPSANLYGKVSPTSAEGVSELLDRDIPILDGGLCEIGIESTIVSFEGERVFLLRKGGVPVESLEEVVRDKIEPYLEMTPIAPGMTKKHYAPRSPLQILEREEPFPNDPSIAILSFGAGLSANDVFAHFELSANQDLREAAKRLFMGMRYLDQKNPARILVRRFPETGLGSALNDRIERAAH